MLTNLIMLAVFIGGIFAWQNTKKEELPDITFDRVRISVNYPGAPAEDVEYFVTKQIEENTKGLDGVYRITSTSSVGQSNVNIELEKNIKDKNEIIAEIRNAVLDVNLPNEITDDPRIRIFKTSKKAIIDIALIYKDILILDTESRRKLQKYALALENQLLSLPVISGINTRGYLQEEIQIKVLPEKLLKYEIPFNTVMSEIKNNHIRKPAGTIQTQKEPKVTLLSELNTPSKLKNLIIQGGFEGQVISLGEIAEIKEGYEKNKSIIKVNGHEAVMLNVVKNSSSGILEALDSVNKTVSSFEKNSLKKIPIQLVLLDDESVDVRNRLSLISLNGSIGFILILIILFIFLNKSSGFWVAIGIPFSLCFTMIFASLLGFTINGTTLAAVIIVMGMIVDDATVVAENITRLISQGKDRVQAAIEGTTDVCMPIIASIATTCIAFIPLFFFEGHFGKFVEHIPPIIFLVLGASLIESLLILPGHMSLRLENPCTFHKQKIPPEVKSQPPRHWFDHVEDKYETILAKTLKHKIWIFLMFLILLLFSGWIASRKMKFVMFPREETREIILMGEAHPGATRYETAKLTQSLDNIINQYLDKEVIGYRTSIARSRRGGAVEENKFRMIIEILPKEKRAKSADQLIKEIESKIEPLESFKKLKFQKSRWGHSSGSPIELIVQQNDDDLRELIVQKISKDMKNFSDLSNVEIDQGLKVDEYKIDINQEKVKRLSINPVDIASTLRAALEGTILYEFPKGDEDTIVRFTTKDEAKDDINKVLQLPIENKGKYLVPLGDIVHVKKVTAPNAISRRNLKRTTIIDADLSPSTKKTPVEIAEHYEENIFPKILSEYPTTTLAFAGEVQDTRESKDDFKNALIMTLLLIYLVLAVLFNSPLKPFIIMLAIPFGVVGIILAFWLHGKILFGFYASIGALGLAGVVINDSIIMLVKLDKDYDKNQKKEKSNNQIANIAKTRLRAVIITTVTTVVGMLPTAYGFAGYDATLSEMMLALTWGLAFGTLITLLLIPTLYSAIKDFKYKFLSRS